MPRRRKTHASDSRSQYTDEYQNLEGEAHRRSVPLRHRAVTHSVRSGEHLEDVVNSIIAVHPGNTKFPFHGNPLSKTEVSYYDKADVPDQPTVILVSDMWGGSPTSTPSSC